MKQVPNITLNDLSPEAYQFISEVLYSFAIKLYKSDTTLQSEGLEACQEALQGLLEKGYIKLAFDKDHNAYLQTYNPTTGTYI